MLLDTVGVSEATSILPRSVAWTSMYLAQHVPPIAYSRRNRGGPIWLRADIERFAASITAGTADDFQPSEYELTWVISTSHLTPAELDDLDIDGIVAERIAFGWRMWVPDDPDDSAAGQEDPPPERILVIQRAARARGADWVIFDADGPTMPDFESFDHS